MVDQAEIHRMAWSEDVEERKRAVEKLKDNFAIIEDKKQAWDDLIQRITDEGSYVSWDIADALDTAFSQVPDKNQAWDDLIRLTSDKDSYVRRSAAYVLGSAFSQVPDKNQAWDDLHRLSSDKDRNVRWGAAAALGSAFSQVPDKNQAWDDLHRLTYDKDSDVRRGAAYALGSAFSQVPDKNQAWDDLHQLTSDKDSDVRWRAAYALGSAFSQVPDKNQAWDDLHRLTYDKDSDVRASAYHSLGKASIFKAANAENDIDLKKEMEAAIGYFEKSSQPSSLRSLYLRFLLAAVGYIEKSSQLSIWSRPAKFCIPFYRSFYMLTFQNEETEAEVQKYIAEAKNAVEGSESKEKLLEAVENLGNALKEIRKVRDFSDIKSDLNAYRRYCDRACELLETTDKKAPGASRLIRKGLPIIDGTIKEILGELKAKSREVCIQTKDKPQNKIAAELYSDIKKLDAENPIKFECQIELLIDSLKMKIPNVKGNEHIIEKIEALRILSDSDYNSLISKLIPIIGAIPQVVIGRDQINIKEFKGSLNTGDIVESLAKR